MDRFWFEAHTVQNLSLKESEDGEVGVGSPARAENSDGAAMSAVVDSGGGGGGGGALGVSLLVSAPRGSRVISAVGLACVYNSFVGSWRACNTASGSGRLEDGFNDSL